MTKNELKQIAEMVAENTMICSKEILTTDEAAKYMGITKSHLYKLTMLRAITHYKPGGKMCYFKRSELDEWLTANRVATTEEIESKAQGYCLSKPGRQKRV